MKKRLLSLLTASLMTMSMLTACTGEKAKNTAEATKPAATEQQQETDANQADAEKLLSDLTGTYQELWPVVLADEYNQTWIDDSAEFVGDEKSEESANMLVSMVTGEVYGEEAVETYKDSGRGAYFCGFTEDIQTITVEDDNVIKGFDSDGKEVFSHRYHYVGMEEQRGLYEYESEDKDSGEFTYFLFAPDTMESTYHIEFRYGSDLEALEKYDSGNYAYWLAAGISTNCTKEMIQDCIHLFCEENLSE